MIEIMILDDHHLVRDGMKAVLHSYDDLKVIGDTGNPEELKTLLKKRKPDVIIVDMIIDGVLLGYDVIEWVSKNHKDIPVLAITMLWEKEYADRAFESGAMGFLPKGQASSALIDAVRKVASGERFVTESGDALPSASGSSYLEDLSSLTRREKEIFSMIGKGQTNKEIGAKYGIQSSTVSSHLENIKKKLKIATLKELTQRAVSYKMKYGSN